MLPDSLDENVVLRMLSRAVELEYKYVVRASFHLITPCQDPCRLLEGMQRDGSDLHSLDIKTRVKGVIPLALSSLNGT